jgi:hypothetical protein
MVDQAQDHLLHKLTRVMLVAQDQAGATLHVVTVLAVRKLDLGERRCVSGHAPVIVLSR